LSQAGQLTNFVDQGDFTKTLRQMIMAGVVQKNSKTLWVDVPSMVTSEGNPHHSRSGIWTANMCAYGYVEDHDQDSTQTPRNGKPVQRL